MGQSPRALSRGVLATRRRRWEGGICWFVRFSPLSRLLKRWTPGSGPLGCLVWSLGDPQAAAVFPRFSPEFADLGADAEVNERGSTSVRWVSGSGTHESFCLALWCLLGLWRLWFRAGVPRVAAVFPWYFPDPGIRFSVELGCRPCSLPMRLEGLAGGSCLSPLWRAVGFVRSPASLPQICQVEGIS
jgi:hypothetical protein